MEKLVFLGNAVAANLLNVGGNNVYQIGDEFAVTTDTAANGKTPVAVYAVSFKEEKVAFKVAFFTELDSFEYQPKKDVTLLKSQTSMRLLLTKNSALIAPACEEAIKVLSAKVEEHKKEIAEQKVRDERAAQSKAKKLADALAVKKELQELMRSIALNTSVYNFDQTVHGKVTSLDLINFNYTVVTEKKETKVLPIYDIITEEALNASFFMNQEPAKLISHAAFKKKMAIIETAENAGLKVFEVAKTEEKYQPQFDYSKDCIYGAERASDGSWEYFSKREVKDNSK